MKILQLANKVPYPPKDGGSIATFAMSKGFRELGHDVTVLAMSTSKHPVVEEDIPQEIRDKIRFILVDVDTRLCPFRAMKNLLFSRMPYNAERFVSKTYGDRLAQLLIGEEFDIIQLEGLYLAPYVPLIRELSEAKVVMRSHNIEHEIWQRTVRQRKGLTRLYTSIIASRVKKMELDCLDYYDATVPITERDAAILQSFGSDIPTHVAPTGINMGDFGKYQGEAEYPSVFHIGALDWSPNQEGLDWFMNKCWKKLHKKYPELRFYIAGRNAPESIKNINEPNVIFLGEVEDAYAFMKSKAVMVVPLLSGSGMRIKIIEGMALGKSIVSTSIGAEGIAVNPGQDIILADDPQKFTAGIESLLDNFDKFEALGSNAIKFVEQNYDNLSISKALIAFYKELI
jgi:glycosyltransferase involved in cell wall biosynthesis